MGDDIGCICEINIFVLDGGVLHDFAFGPKD